jgi:hypothetical protein
VARADNRGGRRSGAGRKPGGLIGSSTSRHSLDTGPPASTQDTAGYGLASLPGPVQMAIRWHVLGRSNAVIAERLRRGRATIARWLADYPEAIAEAVREYADPGELLRPHVPAASRVYGELLEHADRDSTRLAAADSVFDRLFGKPVIREQRSERREVRITFVDAADDGTVPETIDGQAPRARPLAGYSTPESASPT